MNTKFIFSWRGLFLFALMVTLPRTLSAQTNYYWQTIATSVAASGGPQGLGVDVEGDIFFANTFDDTIVKATPSGTNWVVTIIAGQSGSANTNNGIGSFARFDGPNSLAVQSANTLFVADTVNNAIREVHFDGVNWNVTTIAGVCNPDISGYSDGTNQFAQFNFPAGVAMDRQGNLYVADDNNNIIRKIQPSGTNWITTTIAGNNSSSGSSDGTNTDALFAAPLDVAVDASGNLFVADNGNDTIREITPIGTNWVTTTIAGQSGTALGGFSDGTNTDAQFANPSSVAVDGLDNVFVADYYNNAIRKVSPTGGTNWVTTTIGGNGSDSGFMDGTNIVAEFNTPAGVAVDLSGNVYVGDTGNNALRIGYLFPPSLQFVLNGGQLTFSYPFVLSTNFDFILQSTTNLTGSPWLNITNQWQFTTNQIPYVNLMLTNKIPNRFFRLELP